MEVYGEVFGISGLIHIGVRNLKLPLQDL